MEDIYVIGASGHAKVIIDILECMKTHEKIKYSSLYLLDDNHDLLNKEIMGHRVVGKVSDCEKYGNSKFVIAIGNNAIRKKIAETYDLNYICAIHPQSCIAQDVHIFNGTVVMAGAVINSGTVIRKHCIVNTGTTIDHDTQIAAYVHLSPGVHMGGTVSVGEKTWVGIGSTVINNICIGKNCVIGAGTVVIADVENDCKMVGNPARKLKN